MKLNAYFSHWIISIFCLCKVVRNVGIGTASMIARIGSMVAPFILSLKEVSPVYPAIILGVMPLVGAVLVLLLPETQGFVERFLIATKKFQKSNSKINFLTLFLNWIQQASVAGNHWRCWEFRKESQEMTRIKRTKQKESVKLWNRIV